MDVALLSRLQFALAISFHYIFPPISLGLGLILLALQCLYLKTDKVLYYQMVRFWVPVFAMVFGFGAFTGFMMEHEISARWANYFQFIKPSLGNVLLFQALTSFIVELSLICFLLFGLGRVRKFYYLLIILGATAVPHFNAFWIMIMNSWQQNPQGFHLVETSLGWQAQIVDWWAIILNPSLIIRVSHVYTAAWLTGSFLIIGLGAYYLLKKQYKAFAQESIKVGLGISFVVMIVHCFTGHFSALNVYYNQPGKLASMEGHFDSQGPTDLYLLGWVDTTARKTSGIFIPGGVSLLATGKPNTPVLGLSDIPRSLQPPVNFVFQTYHLMILIGVILMILTIYSIWLWWRKKLFGNRTIMYFLAFATFLPIIANQAGWYTAEAGRQPWIVYGLLKTSKGITPFLQQNQLFASILTSLLLYLVLGCLFIYLLVQRVKQGPTMSVEHFKPFSATFRLVKNLRTQIVEERPKNQSERVNWNPWLLIFKTKIIC